jgi:FtsH-binding integral membrane protein
MGLVGLIIAMLVNLFLEGTAIHFLTSTVGVLLFVGFTAYDTQAIKNLYLESDEKEAQSKKAILGALHLYLDFVNISLELLGSMGDS